MHKWWVKCALQLGLSYIPFGKQVNQRWSYRRQINYIGQYALSDSVRQVQTLQDNGINLVGKRVLEIGTGWKPYAAYIFRIAGCSEIILTDLNMYLNRDLLCATLRQIRQQIPTIAESMGLKASEIEKILPQPENQDLQRLLLESGFQYRAPYDLRSTDIPSHSIDVISSRAVFEHVPPGLMKAIFQEVKRILRPDGAIAHIIDHTDHWQHFDHSISAVNFLKFQRWWWNLINSPIAYQNRMRSCEYVKLLTDCGFRMLYLNAPVQEKALADVRSLHLSPEFQGFRDEELAILLTDLIAVPVPLASSF